KLAICDFIACVPAWQLEHEVVTNHNSVGRPRSDTIDSVPPAVVVNVPSGASVPGLVAFLAGVPPEPAAAIAAVAAITATPTPPQMSKRRRAERERARAGLGERRRTCCVLTDGRLLLLIARSAQRRPRGSGRLQRPRRPRRPRSHSGRRSWSRSSRRPG